MTYVWYVLGLVAWAALFGCSAGSNGGDLVVDHRAQESHGCPYLQLAMGYERHGLAALGTEDQLPAFEAFSALTKDRAGLLSVYNSDPNTVPKVGQTPIRGVRLKSARTCVEDGDSNLLTLDATFEMQERPQPQRKPIEGAPACNSAIVQENLAGLWTLQITLCYDEMVLTRKTLNLIMTSVGEGILTVATSTRATSTDDFPMGTWTEEKRLHFTEWAFPQKHNGPDNVQAVIHPAAPPILTITKVDDILQEALSLSAGSNDSVQTDSSLDYRVTSYAQVYAKGAYDAPFDTLNLQASNCGNAAIPYRTVLSLAAILRHAAWIAWQKEGTCLAPYEASAGL